MVADWLLGFSLELKQRLSTSSEMAVWIRWDSSAQKVRNFTYCKVTTGYILTKRTESKQLRKRLYAAHQILCCAINSSITNNIEKQYFIFFNWVHLNHFTVLELEINAFRRSGQTTKFTLRDNVLGLPRQAKKRPMLGPRIRDKVFTVESLIPYPSPVDT